MTCPLHQIASLHSGIYARPQPLADTLYLQVNDFDVHGGFKNKAVPLLHSRRLKPAHLLQEGDILFAAKGTNNFAALYTPGPTPAVASTSFIVIRLRQLFQNPILPAFLAWQLNHPAVLDGLKKRATGSTMPVITLPQLAAAMLQVPPLQKQKAIIELHALHQKEKRLLQRQAQLKETFMQQALLHNIKNQ